MSDILLYNNLPIKFFLEISYFLLKILDIDFTKSSVRFRLNYEYFFNASTVSFLLIVVLDLINA